MRGNRRPLYWLSKTVTRYVYMNGIKTAGLGHAFHTVNTFSATRSFIEMNFNRTYLMTGLAICTGLFIQIQFYQTNPVKKSIKCSKRANRSTKWP